MTELINRNKFTNTLRNDLYKEIKQLSEITRIPMSKLLDEAVEDLVKKYNSKKDVKEKS